MTNDVMGWQKGPRPKKANMSKFQMKTILIVFFNQDSIIQEYLLQNITMNAGR